MYINIATNYLTACLKTLKSISIYSTNYNALILLGRLTVPMVCGRPYAFPMFLLF